MNKITKGVTVRFFSIETQNSYFDNFVSSFVTNRDSSLSSRIFNLKDKKHLIKVSEKFEISDVHAYFVSVVRERNTWQTKATSDGKITGISLNQGIIGDPYYYFVVPQKQVLLGFTTGPIVSLKSVGKTMLDQFNSDRQNDIKLNLIPKEKEFDKLKELPEYSRLHFTITSSAFAEKTEDAPQLIKDLSAAPYIDQDMQLSLELQLDKENVIEIVNFLSEHEGCTVLKVKGLDENGGKVSLDFGDAFLSHKTKIETRHKYIDESLSLGVLKEAFSEFVTSIDY